MKSMILKDLYNIRHNTKSMIIILVILAAALIPTAGAEGYIFACAVMCAMMIITTFAFDNTSKWERYAMIMPVSKKDLVIGKFIVLIIFCSAGSLFGAVVASICGGCFNIISFNSSGIGEILLLTLIAWEISVILGGLSIPFVFKFGAEKGRTILLVSFAVPVAICFGMYKLFDLSCIELTKQFISALICCSPVIILIWCYVMYRISYHIFLKQEF